MSDTKDINNNETDELKDEAVQEAVQEAESCEVPAEEAVGEPNETAETDNASETEVEEAEAEADAETAYQDGEGAEEHKEPTAEDLMLKAAAQIKELQAQTKDWQDKYMRLHAEWDTYRRRMNEQRAAEKVRATEGLMENLLPVLDDFERCVNYAQEHGETGLLDGVIAVQTKLMEVLSKSGLETIDPKGQPFDALESAAVASVPDDSVYDETVAEVYQKGYRMGNKVLRSAMVTVTTGGPRRPAEPKEDEEAQAKEDSGKQD